MKPIIHPTRTVRFRPDSRNASSAYEIRAEDAERWYVEGKIGWDVTNHDAYVPNYSGWCPPPYKRNQR